MKLILALIAISIISCQYETQEYAMFSGKSISELRERLGLTITEKNSNIPTVSYKGLKNILSIPESFDSRTEFDTCVHKIRDQGQCGSCWAFAGSETLSDRFCIASKGEINLVLSPQFMVSCDKAESGCGGGYLDKEWVFLEQQGTVAESCWPYESGSGAQPKCLTQCKDGSALKMYKAVTQSTVYLADIQTIQMEIMANGPVETGFTVYHDFMSYKSGIYVKSWLTWPVGGHAVKIVGWGVENSVKFWIIANSWGTSWGEQGYFRMKMGQCGVDSSAIAAMPQL